MMGVETGVPTTGRRRSMHAMTEINITSFVDIVLVLLIIFMMTSQFLQAGLEVDLPKTSTAGLENKQDPLVVSLGLDKKLLVNDLPVANPDDLGPKIQQALANLGQRPVYLRADRNVPYGAIVKVMESIRQAGVQDVGLMTDAGHEDWFEK
jgi:biopolymer transport protein TolR